VRRVLATIVALVSVGSVATGCSTKFMQGDPERTFSLPNNTHGPRLLRRCDWVDDCRSPDKGKLVRPGESFEFDAYADEEGAYVVANTEGTTFGCIKFNVADGVSPVPESLSDLGRCPRGTPKMS
jgi:hypothetical protein